MGGGGSESERAEKKKERGKRNILFKGKGEVVEI